MNIDKDIDKIQIYGNGYAEGVYDTKTELQPKISELKAELETKEQMVNLMADRISELVEKIYDKKYDKKEVIRLFRSITNKRR